MTSTARPGFHYTPARNWLNDPNGLVWYDGEYHLFYQHDVDSTQHVRMSWGHAVSTDLVTWHELPVAITHTDTEDVFSGSIVVDHHDSSGFGVDGTPAMVAIYTASHPVSGHQAQALAHSTDRGRTWTRYDKNPVLDLDSTQFRDPKVFWHEPGGYWVMVVVLAVEHVVRLYRSADLKSWQHLSDFGPAHAVDGVWECPDLFELQVDDDPMHTRWVLIVSVSDGAVAGGSGMQYFVGDFDGVRFTELEGSPTGAPHGTAWLDFGADYYAAVSFGDTPDGERVLLGWMSNWSYATDTPAGCFRGAMSVPRRHRLATIDGVLRVVQEPTPVTAGLPGTTYELGGATLAPGVMALPGHLHGDQLEIRVSFQAQGAEHVGLHLRVGGEERTVVGYDVARGSLYVDRTRSGVGDFHPAFAAVHHAPLGIRDGLVVLRVLVDSTSVEVFGGRGESVITDQIFPSPDSVGLAVFASGGPAAMSDLSVRVLDVA